MKNGRLIVALLVMCGAMLQTLAGVLPKINSRQSPQDNIVGLTRSDGTVFNGQSTVGLVDENGSFVSARTLANQKVHEKSSLFDEACGRKREEDYGVYFSDKAEVTVADRNVGNAISVNGDHYLKTEDGNLIATIHNHPNGNPWPSILDARAAFIEGRDVLVKNCADDTILRIDHETGDVYLVLKDGSMKYASPDCFFSNDQVRRSYDYQSGISIENLDGHDLYDPKRFRDKKDRDNLAKRDMSESRGSVKKDKSDSPELVVQSETNEVDGVRGWCSCGDQWRPIKPGVSSSEKGLAYTLCVKCGKCVKSSRENNLLYGVKCNDVVMWDRDYARNLCGKYGVNPPMHWMVLSLHCLQGSNGILPTKGDCEFYAEVSRAQEKYFKIPDGEVVVPGRCSCAAPHVSLVGKETSKPFMVCTRCGLVNEPKNGNGINSKVRAGRVRLDCHSKLPQ